MNMSRDFSWTFKHSKDVKLATEESTGFDEVLYNTATPPPFLSVCSKCKNLSFPHKVQNLNHRPQG